MDEVRVTDGQRAQQAEIDRLRRIEAAARLLAMWATPFNAHREFCNDLERLRVALGQDERDEEIAMLRAVLIALRADLPMPHLDDQADDQRARITEALGDSDG